MMGIILFGLEKVGLPGTFDISNSWLFIGDIIMFVLVLSWFFVVLSISYCRRCKFVIAWNRLNRDWLIKSTKGNARCPKCGNKGLQ